MQVDGGGNCGAAKGQEFVDAELRLESLVWLGCARWLGKEGFWRGWGVLAWIVGCVGEDGREMEMGEMWEDERETKGLKVAVSKT
jgi:hypothetical protein